MARTLSWDLDSVVDVRPSRVFAAQVDMLRWGVAAGVSPEDVYLTAVGWH